MIRFSARRHLGSRPAAAMMTAQPQSFAHSAVSMRQFSVVQRVATALVGTAAPIDDRELSPTIFMPEKTKQDKDPIQYIAEVAPIKIDGNTAVCDGGGGALGHPIEYIQLNKVAAHTPATCGYCGLRFVQAHH